MTNKQVAYMIGFVILAMVILAAIATAQPSVGRQCGSMDTMERILLIDRHEELMAVGHTGKLGFSQAMRLYVNPKSRSWTLISINPGGLACVQAAGEAFEFTKPELRGEPS